MKVRELTSLVCHALQTLSAFCDFIDVVPQDICCLADLSVDILCPSRAPSSASAILRDVRVVLAVVVAHGA